MIAHHDDFQHGPQFLARLLQFAGWLIEQMAFVACLLALVAWVLWIEAERLLSQADFQTFDYRATAACKYLLIAVGAYLLFMFLGGWFAGNFDGVVR